MKRAVYQAHNLQSGPQGWNLVPDHAEHLSDHWHILSSHRLPTIIILRPPFPSQSGLQFLRSEESLEVTSPLLQGRR